MRIAYDLTVFADFLEKQNLHTELVKLIRQRSACYSLENDIRSVTECLDRLDAIDAASPSDRVWVGQALMSCAVMMYCRATIEDGNGRFAVGTTRDLNEDQKKKQADIVAFRNRVIGHFGKADGQYGEGWINERLVFKPSEEGFGISGVCHRASFRSDLIADLRELSAVVNNRVIELRKDRSKKLSILLMSLCADVHFIQLISQYEFSPETFFPEADPEIFWESPLGASHETRLKSGEIIVNPIEVYPETYPVNVSPL